MNIFEYVKQLKKRFTKRNVNGAIDVINTELVNVTIPLIEKQLEFLRKNDKDLTSQFYQRDRDAIIKDFAVTGYLRPTNPFDMLYKSLTNSVEILSYLKGYFDDAGVEDITGESVTIAKANVLQLIDLIAFASKYSLAWIDVVISAESNHRNQLAGEVNLTQQQIIYLDDNRASFGRVIAILATPVKKITEMLDNIPDVVIAETNPKLLNATQGTGRLDPLTMGLVQSKWNPIYVLDMLESDFFVWRYKVAKEEAEMLELKILRLKKQMQNNNDPKLATIIENRQGQLDKYRGKLQKMENGVKLGN